MKEFVKRFFFPIIWCLAALILFVPGFARIQHLKNKNHDLQRKNKRLTVENELLKNELSRLENDNIYQEKVLREKMGVVRKDEVPVKIISDANN